MPQDEMWTMKDGTQIAVNDMTENHVRNALRMVIRGDNRRRQRMMASLIAKAENEALLDGSIDVQDMLSTESYNQLSNPNAYFPLLNCHGSSELATRHDPRRK